MRKCALKQRGEVLYMETDAGGLPLISSGFEDFCPKVQSMLQLTRVLANDMCPKIALKLWERLGVGAV